jgi:hypothetical protein
VKRAAQIVVEPFQRLLTNDLRRSRRDQPDPVPERLA